MNIRDKVLLVEDERTIRSFMQAILTANGYDVLMAGTGAMANTMIASHCPDIIILDLGLPDMDGMQLLKAVRQWSKVPVVVVSARSHERDKVAALDAGADDYLTKPFGTEELLARIRTVLRRASDKGQAAAQSDIRRFAGWTLNVRSRELSQGDERIALSDAMYRLLLVFLDEPFAVLSREYLLRQTQGRDADVFDRSVDIQVSRLRGVLKDTGTSKIIKTVRGGGYMLSVDVEHDA